MDGYKRGDDVSLRYCPLEPTTVTMKKGHAGCCWMLDPEVLGRASFRRKRPSAWLGIADSANAPMTAWSRFCISVKRRRIGDGKNITYQEEY